MKTDKGLNRYEIHLTDSLMSQIEQVALDKFDAKIHHRSGKPMIKEAVITLLELGIDAINDGVEPIKKSDSDNHTDINRISLDQVNQLIIERLKPLQDRLNRFTDNYTVINSDTILSHIDSEEKTTENESRKKKSNLEIFTDYLSSLRGGEIIEGTRTEIEIKVFGKKNTFLSKTTAKNLFNQHFAEISKNKYRKK